MIKTPFAAVAASLMLAGAASAQTTPAAPAAANAPAARPTIESTIESLINEPATKTVVLKHLPALDQHPAYSQFKGMTLRAVAPFSDGHVTDETITAIDTELKALPKA